MDCYHGAPHYLPNVEPEALVATTKLPALGGRHELVIALSRIQKNVNEIVEIFKRFRKTLLEC